jgi:hypothetical protein
MGKRTFSYHLFSKPSFIKGLGRLWDFRGQLSHYNTSKTDELADIKALYSDWLAAGEDLRSGMHTYERERQR